MAPAHKVVIRLTDEQRQALQALVRTGTHKAHARIRAQILLKTRQAFEDVFDGRNGESVGNRIGVVVPDRFQCVGQRIQSGGNRHRRRHAEHQVRVDQRHLGPGARQVQGIFLLLRGIPQSRPRGHFASGAGGGGRGDQGLAARRGERFATGQQFQQFFQGGQGNNWQTQKFNRRNELQQWVVGFHGGPQPFSNEWYENHPQAWHVHRDNDAWEIATAAGVLGWLGWQATRPYNNTVYVYDPVPVQTVVVNGQVVVDGPKMNAIPAGRVLTPKAACV